MFGLSGPDLAFVVLMGIAQIAIILGSYYIYREHKRGNPDVKDLKSILRLMKPW